MQLTRRNLLGTIAATTALSGCAGDDGPGGQPTGTATETATPTKTATTTDDASAPAVRVSSHPELGDILVDSEGRTLYMFDNDTNGEGTSACYDGCAESWPPLTVEDDPSAGDDVTADLDTFEREDGTRQVTAGGWPLYYFASDGDPGDANGQGVGDVWWVLGPDGTPVGPETTETESGGDGYSY